MAKVIFITALPANKATGIRRLLFHALIDFPSFWNFDTIVFNTDALARFVGDFAIACASDATIPSNQCMTQARPGLFVASSKRHESIVSLGETRREYWQYSVHLMK